MSVIKRDIAEVKCGFYRVYWVGKHLEHRSMRTRKLLNSPLGRLPSTIVKLLVNEFGWEEIKDFSNDTRLPVFTFCSRKLTNDFYPVQLTKDTFQIISNEVRHSLACERKNHICDPASVSTLKNCITEVDSNSINYCKSHEYISQLSSKNTRPVDCKLNLWNHLKRIYLNPGECFITSDPNTYTAFLKANLPFPFTLEWEELKEFIEEKYE